MKMDGLTLVVLRLTIKISYVELASAESSPCVGGQTFTLLRPETGSLLRSRANAERTAFGTGIRRNCCV